MVVANFRGDAEIGAKESRAQLRDQFLAGVAVIAEPLRVEGAIKPRLVVGPVRELVQCGRVIAFLVAEGAAPLSNRFMNSEIPRKGSSPARAETPPRRLCAHSE
jgi:hypothetical protein